MFFMTALPNWLKILQTSQNGSKKKKYIKFFLLRTIKSFGGLSFLNMFDIKKSCHVKSCQVGRLSTSIRIKRLLTPENSCKPGQYISPVMWSSGQDCRRGVSLFKSNQSCEWLQIKQYMMGVVCFNYFSGSISLWNWYVAIFLSCCFRDCGHKCCAVCTGLFMNTNQNICECFIYLFFILD